MDRKEDLLEGKYWFIKVENKYNTGLLYIA